jgi:hypothetical protein
MARTLATCSIDTFVRNDIEKWRKVIEAAKVPVD